MEKSNYKYHAILCPGCHSFLRVKYHIVKGSVLIDLIDSDFGLEDCCANCKYNFDENELEKIAEKIEKEITEDN